MALALGLTVIGGGGVARPVTGFAAGSTVVLSQNVLPGLDKLTSTGAPASSQALNIAINLRRPHLSEETAFIQSLQDPSSPWYHRYLTPVEFRAVFGVEQARFDATLDYLRGGGLRVATVPGSRDIALATGTVAQVESLFQTTIRNFTSAGRSFYANVVAPRVPVALGVNYVMGLNNLEGGRLAPAVGPNTGFITPKELWSVYNQPDSDKGEGQSMAIFGWGVTDDGTNSVEKDLRTFEAEFGFPAIPYSIQYFGDPTIVIKDTVGAGEWRLDTQASTGMAPNADGEKLYFGRDGSDASILAAYSGWVNDANGPLQGSSSFSGCETSPQIPASQQDTVFQPAAELILQQAVAEGRTMFASAGDTGASCPFFPVNVNGVGTELVPLQGYPAVSPSAVGVGGTVLYTDGNTPASRFQETAWTHTGGGTSPYIKAPSYQVGTTGVTAVCVSDEQGNPYVPPVTCRGVPDVAAISGDIVSNGYPITVNGAKDSQGAGTSLSSPLWLGMWTRLQAAAPTTAGKGFANPIFYAQGQNPTTEAADFYDIGGATDGHTAVTCNLSPYCSHIGWDYVSGWGTPHLQQLMMDVDQTTTPLCQTTQSCPPLQPVPGATGSGPNINPCVPLYTVAPNDPDAYTAGEGQITGDLPSQLDILSGNMQLTSDGLTLRVTMTIADLNAMLPMGSGENDYRVLWNNGSTKYFALAAVQLDGTVIYTDGQAIVTPATTRYQPLNVDTGSFGSGPGGIVEIDVPLTNINAPSGTLLTAITGETDIRNGTATTGLLTVEDTAGPGFDYQVGETCAPVVPEAPFSSGLVIGGGAALSVSALVIRRRRRAASR